MNESYLYLANEYERKLDRDRQSKIEYYTRRIRHILFWIDADVVEKKDLDELDRLFEILKSFHE